VNPTSLPSHELAADFWINVDHQRDHIHHLAIQLGVQKPEDWYHVRIEDVKRCGGAKLIEYYNDSLFDMLCAVRPDVSWVPWRFIDPKQRTYPAYWKVEANVKQFFQYLEKEFSINKRMQSDNVSEISEEWKIGSK
jgi:hypothetical protein